MKLFSSALAAVLLTTGLGAGIAIAGPHGHRADKLAERFDRNGNGQLEPAERAEADAFIAQRQAERQARMLARFDQNRDGTLDATEQAAADRAKAEHRAGRHGNKLARFDQNRDGQIDAAEKAAARTARIDRMMKRFDLDGNGAITRAELERAAPEHRNRGAGDRRD